MGEVMSCLEKDVRSLSETGNQGIAHHNLKWTGPGKSLVEIPGKLLFSAAQKLGHLLSAALLLTPSSRPLLNSIAIT